MIIDFNCKLIQTTQFLQQLLVVREKKNKELVHQLSIVFLCL